ncbi:MAG: C45 family peptidase [Chloroflexota bacterium]
MKQGKIRVQTLQGTPFEMGFQHGQAYKNEIRHYAEERVSLVQSGTWTGGQQITRQEVLALAEGCLPAHEAYAPDLMDEFRGMAQATGLSLAEMVVVSGFTDFIDTVYAHYKIKEPLAPMLAIDDCTAFIVPNGRSEGAGFFGQTWDMHDTATEFVILLDVQPEDSAKSLVFTTTGCVGQIGMNEHGIAVGINNLLGADGQVGVTWPFVVRKVLQQDNIDDALACITDAQLAGAHNFLLMDKNGRGYNIEAMSTHYHLQALNGEPIVHTNHCLIPETIALAQPRLPASQENSENRLNLAEDLLEKESITIEDLQEMTRQAPICQTAVPPFHVESCGAAIMRPQTGDFWAVWGPPAENEYEHFQV